MKNNKVKIYGFTLLRNGVKYDYSFRECLLSLKPICEHVQLALGESEDGTEKAVADLDFLKITPTVWDDSLREGGLILSQQTNVALDALREECKEEESAWGIYLQCDEVLHEEDYEMIKADIQKAEDEGCDVVRFRYLHFWQTHHDLAINKKWYPQEIRAVKLKTNIESWGDAQSFRHFEKAYESDARVYHYGHVREQDSYLQKKADIMRLYHADEKLAKYKRREKRFDDQTECLLYFGKHPELMKGRISRMNDIWSLDQVDRVDIVGDRGLYSSELIKKINAKEVFFWEKVEHIPAEFRKKAIKTSQSFWDRVLRKNNIPSKMRSKLAREWPKDFTLTLRLSSQGIGLKG